MKKKLKIYLPFTRAGIQRMMAYRMNFSLFFIGESLYCFVMYFLWQAIFNANHTERFMGFTRLEMVLFVFLSNIITFLVNSDMMEDLGTEIKDGSIIMRMIKPINLDFSFLFMELGTKIVILIGIGLPIVLGLEIYRYCMTGCILFDIGRFLLFLLSTILGYWISFYLNLCFGFMAFFFNNIWGFSMLKQALLKFLTGSMIPIAFMPALLQKVLNLLPFASMSYTPVMIYIGKYDRLQILQSIGLQLIWVIIIYGLSRAIWKIATDHLTVQGG